MKNLTVSSSQTMLVVTLVNDRLKSNEETLRHIAGSLNEEFYTKVIDGERIDLLDLKNQLIQ